MPRRDQRYVDDALLTDAIDTAGALLQTVRSPGQIDIDDPAARRLQIQPLARNVCRDKDRAFASGETTKLRVLLLGIQPAMVLSVRTSPHAYAVYEVDFHKIERLRQTKKSTYEQAGAKLTYTSFVAKAVVESIREFPFVNASLDGENVIYKRDVNLGIAVALDAGLIVPVIPDAGGKDLLSLSKSIQDLAHRARSKQLKPEEVQGGTFTITNPGVFGALFGLPIPNQPQVAILAVGTIDKRVVVVDDMLCARVMRGTSSIAKRIAPRSATARDASMDVSGSAKPISS